MPVDAPGAVATAPPPAPSTPTAGASCRGGRAQPRRPLAARAGACLRHNRPPRMRSPCPLCSPGIVTRRRPAILCRAEMGPEERDQAEVGAAGAPAARPLVPTRAGQLRLLLRLRCGCTTPALHLCCPSMHALAGPAAAAPTPTAPPASPAPQWQRQWNGPSSSSSSRPDFGAGAFPSSSSGGAFPGSQERQWAKAEEPMVFSPDLGTPPVVSRGNRSSQRMHTVGWQAEAAWTACHVGPACMPGPAGAAARRS